MQIIDLHCDTIMRFYDGESLAGNQRAHISLEKLRQGGCMAQCFAIFVPTHAAASRRGITDGPEAYVHRAWEAFRREMAANAGAIVQARSMAEVEENHRRGLMSAILTVEDAVSLEGHLERLEDYQTMGVRMVALTWNYENSLGYPNSDDGAAHSQGLKPFGIEAVRRMGELGMAVDVSHLSEGGFWDVARYARGPFVASHSCARSLRDHRRNLTDRQLRALADKGGVVGVNFCADFLHPVRGPEENRTDAEDIARHLLHMRRAAGVDVLALGSDFDGIRSVLSFGDYGGMGQLVQALERHFSPEELEKICWRNAWRTLRDIWGA